jgi:phosphatidylserine/phosphatidylglycerophosphate/cardiolipin synthase-like enzyme
MDSGANIVATGNKWIGYGIKPTSSAIKELINSANKSLLLTIFILTDRMILEHIQKALNRGVKVEVFIHNDKDFSNSIMDDILELEEKYPHMKVFIVSEDFMHAKVLISDKKSLLIGSANLTRSGLSKNYELGITLNNPKIAYDLERIIKRLIE